jgi:hypothetical protein
MSSRKPSLAAALHEASGRRPPVSEDAAGKGEEAAHRRPFGRHGKKIISGHFDPAVSRQLKQMALDGNSNVQELLAEALNDLFAKHGKNPIA